MKKEPRPAGPALKHSLGQNFILDPGLQRELAGLTGLAGGDEVLEIGAGSGMLTVALAERVKPVTAVELDREMIPYLKAAVLPFPVRSKSTYSFNHLYDIFIAMFIVFSKICAKVQKNPEPCK